MDSKTPNPLLVLLVRDVNVHIYIYTHSLYRSPSSFKIALFPFYFLFSRSILSPRGKHSSQSIPNFPSHSHRVHQMMRLFRTITRNWSLKADDDKATAVLLFGNFFFILLVIFGEVIKDFWLSDQKVSFTTYFLIKKVQSLSDQMVSFPTYTQ